MEFVKYEKREYIAVITLDRAPVNAFNTQMYLDLEEAFNTAGADKEVRAIILTSIGGKFYSAGNDVNDFNDLDSDGNYYDAVNVGLGAVFECEKPIIAAVNGIAVGSGFVTVSASDIVISVKEARFGIPEVKVGIVGGGPEASYSLPNNMLKYMVLTGDTLPAEDLYRVGVIHKIVESENLMDEAFKIAEKLVNNPPLALKYGKQSYKQIFQLDKILNEYCPFTDEKTNYHVTTPDFKEAVSAFIEKRKPNYTGEEI